MEANDQPTAIRKQVVHQLTSQFSRAYQDTMAQYPFGLQAEQNEHLKGLLEDIAASIMVQSG